MTEEKKEIKKEEERKMRKIMIETDGNMINIVKAEVAGNLELVAILESILNQLKK